MRGGRVAVFLLVGVLALLVGGIWLLLYAIEGRVEPACLRKVAEAPESAFWKSSGAADEALEIEYEDGVQLQVERSPLRIASTVPGITEMVAFLGRGDRLVAVSKWCDFPPEAVEGLPRISVLPFNPEGFLALQPDLLLVDRRLHRRDLDVIRRRVPNLLLLDTSRSFGHLQASFELLERVLGTDAAGAESYRLWQAEAAELLQRIKARHLAIPPRVLVVGQWDPLYVLGRGSLIDDLLRLCGCVNVACDLEGDASGNFPEELVLARRPDWILTPREPLPDRLRERWHNLPAVKQGRLVDGSADDLVRAGPRLLRGLARLADTLLGKTACEEAK